MEVSGKDMRDGRTEVIEQIPRMLGDRLLIEPLETKLSDTLIAEHKGRTLRGKVIAVGPGEYRNLYNADRSSRKQSKVFTPTVVKVGDIVELGGMDIGGYAFPQVMIGTKAHLICSEKDVCGVHQ